MNCHSNDIGIVSCHLTSRQTNTIHHHGCTLYGIYIGIKCICFVFCSKPVKISDFVTYLEKLEKDSGLKLTEEYEVIHSVYDSYLIAML